MKRIFPLLLVLLFLSSFTIKGQTIYPSIPDYSCLMADGMVRFSIYPKLIAVKFKEGISANTVGSILANEKLIRYTEPESNLSDEYKFPMILSIDESANSQSVWEVLCRLRLLNAIEYANPFLRGRTETELASFNNNILVKLKSKENKSSIENFVKSHNYQFSKNELLGKETYQIIVNGNSDAVFSISSELRKLSYVEFAEPDFIIFIKQNSNDPLFPKQWYLKNTGNLFPSNVTQTIGEDIHIEDAWNLLGGLNSVQSQNANIKVAVLDIWGDLSSTTHPDISNMQGAYDATATGFVSLNYHAESHGINCAGVIGANANNNLGIAGVAPNTRLYPVKIGRFTNTGGHWNGVPVSNISSVIIGINLSAFTIGADIISNSNSFDIATNGLESAINNCIQNGRGGKGCVFVSSSGNDNTSVAFPAYKPNVLSVGATTMCGTRWVNSNICGLTSSLTDGSNYGSGLKVSAPGTYITTTDIVGAKGSDTTDYHQSFSGTSAACPIVAGIAALILSVNPGLSETDVRNIIESTCDKIATSPYTTNIAHPNGTWNQYLGYGRVNAYQAVSKAAYQIKLNAPITVTPSNISQCTTITVSANVKNDGSMNWAGKIYISLHKMNDDFIQDLIVAPNILIPSGANSVISVTVPLNTISQIAAGNIYKIYIKYQTNGTPYPNEYPHVDAGSFLNPTFLPVNNSPTCDSLAVPPGNYKEVYLAGLNLNAQTNNLEFIIQGVPAQLGDVPVDLNVETEKIKKRFKQALVIPPGNQWASLSRQSDGHGWYTGDAIVGNNFENTDLSRDYLIGDYNFKHGSIVTPIETPSSIENYWTSLVNQGPYLAQLQSQAYSYYPNWQVWAGLYTEGLNYNSQGPTKILINGAIWKMTSGVDWIDLPGVNNLPPNLRNTLMSKVPNYQNELGNRMQMGVNQTLPLVNGVDPRYSTLRKDYRISTAAYWYRTLIYYTNKPFHSKINSNDLSGISADTPYDDQFWNSQAFQNLGCSSILTDYKSNQFYECVFGQSGSYNTYLVDSGAFSPTQVNVDSICFKNHGYAFQGSAVYFYGGILKESVPDLLPVISNLSSHEPVLGDTVHVQVKVYNMGNSNAQMFPTRLYEQYLSSQNVPQNILIGQQTISLIDSFGNQTLQFNWIPLSYGSKKLLVTVDEGNSVIEHLETNNSTSDSLVIQNNIPTATIISPANGSSTTNKDITLVGNAIDPHEGYLTGNNVSWSSNLDGFLGNGSSLTLDSLSVGNHTITYTATNSHGQVASAYINIFVFSTYPIANILSPSSGSIFPNNAPILFSGQTIDYVDGSLCNSTQWTSSLVGNLGTGCNITVQLPIGNHSITFSAQNSSGNTASSNIQVNVIDGTPTLSISSPLSNSYYYQNQPVILSGNASDFPQGNISSNIHWSSNLQGNLGVGQSITVSLIPGIHTITAYVQDNAGSVATASLSPVNIRYNPPVPQIIQPVTNQIFLFHDTVKLIGHATDIQDGSLHGSRLKWYSNIQGFIGFGDTVQTNILTYGYHTISLKATDSDGNDSTSSVSNIYIDAGLPVVTISQPINGSTYFFGNSVTITGTAIDPQDGNLVGNSLQWNSDVNGFLGIGNSVSTNSLSAGNQIITLTATDHDGFVVSSSVNFYIEPPHPPVISIYYPFNNYHAIHGSPITLKANVSDYEEGVLNDNRVTWSSSISGNLGTGKIISVNNLPYGTHIISVTAIDTTGLTTTTTIQIIIDQQKPIAQINSPVSGSAFSQGVNVAFIGSATDYEDGTLPGTSLQWSSDVNGNIGSGNTISTSALSVGSHLISLVATDSQNAKDTATIVVIIQGPHNVIQNKFLGNKDSVVATFGISGGDSTMYFTLPQKAIVQTAQFTVIGDSVPFNTVEYVFAKRMGSSLVGQVLQSKFGPVYSVGYGGYGTFGNLTQSGSGAAFFVAKQKQDGTTQWVKSYSLGSNPIYYSESLGHIVEDAQGNIYAFGSFRWSINFGVDSFVNCSAYDAFVMKLDSNGNYLWAKHIYSGPGTMPSEDFAANLAIDNSGYLYLTGHFDNDGLGYIGNYSFALNGGFTGFLAKMDLAGNVMWERSIGALTTCSAVKVNNAGAIFVTGCSNTTNFDGISFTSLGNYDAFLAKYNQAGTIQWVRGGGSTSSDEISDLYIDSLNNVHSVGYTSGNITWGSSTATGYGGSDYFICKHDVNGNLLDIRVGGGTGSEMANTIVPIGDKYYVGGYSPSTTFQCDTVLLANALSNNSIVIKQNLNGTSLSGFKIINGSTGNVSLYSLEAEQYGNLLLGGSLTGTIGNFNLGGSGGFVAKRNRNPSQYPFKAFTDVLSDSNKEWQNSGYFSSTANSSNFTSTLNSYLTSYIGSIATIPIQLHSDSAGKVKLKFLNIQYLITDTISPSFVNAKLVPNSLAKNSTFAVRVKVSDNEKVDSVNAVFNNITYNLTQVSTDSFTVSILADTVGYFPVTITVSDTNGLTHDTVLYVTVYSTTRDLEVLSSNISILPTTIFTNDSVHLTAIVKNNSNLTITNAQVALIIDGVTQQTKIVTLTSLAQTQISFAWLAKWGQDTIVIKADPSNLVVEANENNNTGSQYIFINDIYSPAILQATANPNPAYVGNQVFFKVKAIDSTGIASVTVNWQSQIVTLTYNSLSTFYEGYVNANTTGTTNAIITAYDVNSLSSSTNISVQVLQNLSDLKVYSSDFLFVPAISGSGSSASIQIKVHNSGSVNANNTNVILRADGLNIGSQSATILHDSSLVFSFSWLVNCGSHTFVVVVDSANAIAETNEANNTASIAHQFCASVPSYILNAQAIPAILPLGSATSVQLNSVPATTNGAVTVLWNNQNTPMPYSSLNGNYSVPVYPTQTGSYTLPVSFTDANGFQSATFVQFTVVDSLPDLLVNSISTNYPVQPNISNQFSISVSNNSLQTISSSTLYLLADSQVVDSIQIAPVNSLATVIVQLNWYSTVGTHQLTTTIDLHNQITEASETNNSKSILLTVQDNQPPVIHYMNTSTPTYQGGSMQVSSYVTDNDSVASVVANFMGNNYFMLYDSVLGTWQVTLNTTLNGTLPLTITATDNFSLVASAIVPIVVNNNLPDLEVKTQNIIFTHIDSVTNEITAILQNIGGGMANNTKVHFIINGVLVDSLILNFSIGQSDTVIFVFNYPASVSTATITLDPANAISEGNEANNSASRIIFIPDLTAPPSPVVTVTPSSWSASQTFSVSWNQVFDNSGTVTYEYSVNGSAWTSVGINLSTNVTAPVEGLSYVYVRAKDVFGNLSQPGVAEMKYDNTAPNAPLIAEYHCGTSWSMHESPLIEWLNPGDIGSGIESFEVSIDNLSPVNIGFNFNSHDTLLSGIHTLKVRAVDYVGHIGNWSNVITVFIDLDNPNCPDIISITHPDQNTWYKSDSVVFDWTRPTETSSITGYFYRVNHDSISIVDQSGYWIGKDSLTLTHLPCFDSTQIRIPDGVWYIHMVSQDTVGHVSSSTCAYRFMIDKTPPFSTANYLDTVTNCNYSFTIQSEDYYSGVSSIRYRINAGNWITDSIVLVNTVGLNLIEFYSVDVAGNIEKIDTARVFINNQSVSLNLGNDTTICSGQLLPLNAGNQGATYNWGDGSTNQTFIANQSGAYWVRVEKNGCTSSDTIHLNFTSPSVLIVADSSTICSSDSVYLCATTGLNLYQWNSGQSTPCIYAKLAGNYYLTVTDSYGCSAESNHIAVIVHPLPPVSITVNGDTLTAYNAATFQWFRNDTLLPGATTPSYIANTTGYYSVLVTDTNGCIAISNKLNIVLGVERLDQNDKIEIYPNPMETGGWNLVVGDNIVGSEFEIFDNNSKLVYKSKIYRSHSEIDIDVAGGMYLLRINTPKTIVMRKLVKM